jgi:hypothetical protein
LQPVDEADLPCFVDQQDDSRKCGEDTSQDFGVQR